MPVRPLIVSQHLLQVLGDLAGVCASELVGLSENVEHVWRDERWEVRTQSDALNVQVEERQEHSHSLLLEPRDTQVQWKVIDTSVECTREQECHFDCRVGVVALANVQQTWQAIWVAANCAEFQAVDAELAATHGEDQSIVWQASSDIGEV